MHKIGFIHRISPLSRVLSILVSSALLRIGRAESEELADPRVELDEVLRQSQYHPRSQSKGWFQELWSAYGESVWSRIKSSVRWLRDRLPDVEQPDWLRAFGDVVAEVVRTIEAILGAAFDLLSSNFWVVLVFALLGLLYLGWRYRKKIGMCPSPTTRNRDLSRSHDRVFQALDLKELFEKGDYRSLIEAMRGEVRTQVVERYSTGNALTDRELACKVAKTDHDAWLFEEVANAFEESAFAGSAIDQDRVKRLYRNVSAFTPKGRAKL